jgi:hypothetical protein
MSAALDQLEKRVNAVADLVLHLRQEIARLELQIAEQPRTAPPAPTPPPPLAQTLPPPDDTALEELSRLRAERTLVRERIRGLIREIDQVSW